MTNDQLEAARAALIKALDYCDQLDPGHEPEMRSLIVDALTALEGEG